MHNRLQMFEYDEDMKKYIKKSIRLNEKNSSRTDLDEFVSKLNRKMEGVEVCVKNNPEMIVYNMKPSR